MKTQIALVLVSGLAFAAPVSGLASDGRRVEIAEPGGAAAGVGAAQEREGLGDIPFEDRVASFINEFYLSSDRRTDEDLERLYSARVDYFGKGRWSRVRVIGDKRSYYARWQRRSYALLRDTLRVDRRPGPDKIFDVAFEYTFDVGSTSKVSRGRGRALLTMDLGQEGGRITREAGEVIERW